MSDRWVFSPPTSEGPERTVIAKGGQYFNRIRFYSKHTKTTDFVFCDNETGKPINRKVFYDLWKKILVLSGLEKTERKLSYYSLRHFGITMRRYAGVSFEDLSMLAGTSFSFIENHYSHIETGRLLEAATKGFTVDKDGFVLRDEERPNRRLRHRYRRSRVSIFAQATEQSCE
jgi:hypothetical protein